MAKDLAVLSAGEFYQKALLQITESDIPFLVGGATALKVHTGIQRETKDLDLFCKASDYPKILKILIDNNWKSEITDARWIAKAFHNTHYIDLIFSTPTGACTVDDSWFEHATPFDLYDIPLKCVASEELIWCKAFVQERVRFDGADINHIILKQGRVLDWERLLMRMDPYWEILFGHILFFRFIYPSERNAVPRWVMEELIQRVNDQQDIPLPKDKVCRGPLVSQTQYEKDFKEWGFRVITTYM